jgi:hypothetical protein
MARYWTSKRSFSRRSSRDRFRDLAGTSREFHGTYRQFGWSSLRLSCFWIDAIRPTHSSTALYRGATSSRQRLSPTAVADTLPAHQAHFFRKVLKTLCKILSPNCRELIASGAQWFHADCIRSPPRPQPSPRRSVGDPPDLICRRSARCVPPPSPLPPPLPHPRSGDHGPRTTIHAPRLPSRKTDL